MVGMPTAVKDPEMKDSLSRVRVLHRAMNFAITSCCFEQNRKEMFPSVCRTNSVVLPVAPLFPSSLLVSTVMSIFQVTSIAIR